MLPAPCPAHVRRASRRRASEREREVVAVSALRAASSAGSVVINGDLFDFWFEWRTVMPRGHVRVLGALAALVDAGTPVLMVAGNHDAWGGGSAHARDRRARSFTAHGMESSADGARTSRMATAARAGGSKLSGASGASCAIRSRFERSARCIPTSRRGWQRHLESQPRARRNRWRKRAARRRARLSGCASRHRARGLRSLARRDARARAGRRRVRESRRVDARAGVSRHAPGAHRAARVERIIRG